MERKCFHRTDGTCFRYTVDPVLSVKLPFIVKGSKKKLLLEGLHWSISFQLIQMVTSA